MDSHDWLFGDGPRFPEEGVGGIAGLSPERKRKQGLAAQRSYGELRKLTTGGTTGLKPVASYVTNMGILAGRQVMSPQPKSQPFTGGVRSKVGGGGVDSSQSSGSGIVFKAGGSGSGTATVSGSGPGQRSGQRSGLGRTPGMTRSRESVVVRK